MLGFRGVEHQDHTRGSSGLAHSDLEPVKSIPISGVWWADEGCGPHCSQRL